MGKALRKAKRLTLREQFIRSGIIQEAKPTPSVKPNPQGGITTVSPPADKSLTSKVTPNPQGGINVNHWFWAAMDQLGTEPAAKVQPVSGAAPDSSAGDAQADIGQILTDHPGISGPTLFNLLKSKGWTIAPPKTQEADGSSANAQALRDPGPKKEAGSLKWTTFSKFKEATPRGDTGKGGFTFRCRLLTEGMGNLRDRYYYSKEALQSAIPIFEGKKIYADHPSATEEEIRPERSVRDVLGHFENLAFEEADGVGGLMGDVHILPDQSFEWARALMRHSVDFAKKYPDKDFIGLSINAGGDAEEVSIQEAIKKGIPDQAMLKVKEAQDQGIEGLKWVSKITEAVSCDLVTEAGAGGRIVTMLENEKTKGNQMGKPGKVKEAVDKKVKEDEGADAAGAGHADAGQDAELIKKMLGEFLGDPEHDEDTMKAGQEAYKCAMEAYEGDEKQAYQAAGHAMKLARHMKMKNPGGAEAGDTAAPAAAASGGDAAHHDAPAPQAEAGAVADDEKKKESAAENLRLKGENAKLREQIAAGETEKYLDKVLKESGLPVQTTKLFRESAGKFKNKEEIDSKFKLFQEGHKAAGRAGFLDDVLVQPEKSGDQPAQTGDFSDCVN